MPELGVSVFVLPKGETKYDEERIVILNTVARRVTDERRGEHSEFVFSWKGEPLKKLSNTSRKKAKARSKLPIRLNDLRHTFGHRLRAVGAPLEDRKVLLEHTKSEITTHYSAAEPGTLLTWAGAIVDAKPSAALRTGFAGNAVELRRERGDLELPGFRGHYKSLFAKEGGDSCPGEAKIEAFAEYTSSSGRISTSMTLE